MKKIKIWGVCILGILTPLLSHAQNNVGIELFGGTEYSPREKGEGFHFGFGYDKEFAKGNSFIAISMSGKREVLRQYNDTVSFPRKFYVLETSTGLSINDERSKLFAGPIIVVGGGVCWDNWKLEGSFPVFFVTALQLNINIPDNLAISDEKFGLGFFGRCSYENFYYKVTDEPNAPSQSRVNPMITYEVGLRLILRGDSN